MENTQPHPFATWRLAVRQLRDVIASPRRALLRSVAEQGSWRGATTLVCATIGLGGALSAWLSPAHERALAHGPVRIALAIGGGLLAAALSLLVIAGASAGLLWMSGLLMGGRLTFAACFQMLVCVSFPASIGTVVQPVNWHLHGHAPAAPGHQSFAITVFHIWSAALLVYGIWLVRMTRIHSAHH